MVERPLPVPLPFPQLWRPEVQRHGDVGPAPRPPHVDVELLPVLARLGSSAAVQPLLERSLADLKSESTLRRTPGYVKLSWP